jgi:uncharacterized protein YgbK (DUF1537 family)
MGTKQTIILADDLTGANDTAIQFVNHGLSALVLTHSDLPNPQALVRYDVISINSNSRAMTSGDAYRELRTIVKRMAPNGREGFFYKKVDSVLRGNPGTELAAVMDELGIPLAVVAPSFPANQSILEHGRLSSGAGVIDAIDVFAREMKVPVEGVPLDVIRGGKDSGIAYILSHHARGKRVFVADAVTDTDLEKICHIAASLGKPLVMAGAAGLANHIAKDRSREKPNRTGIADHGPSLRRGPVLVIAGTRQGETSAQVSALSQTRSLPVIRFHTAMVGQGKAEAAIRAAYEDVAEEMKKKPEACIVAVESMFESGIPVGNVDRDEGGGAEGAAIAAALGVLTAKLLHRYQFPVIISSGGDTSLGICKQLTVTGIEPVAEICPGIPLGRIVGGPCEDRYLITKSGRFGNRDSFLEIMNFLSQEEKK